MAIVQVWVTVSTTTYITRKMSLRGLSFARSGLTASLDVAGAASLRSRPFSCSGCHAYNRYPFKKQTDRKSTIRHQAQKDLERDAALAPSRAESSRRAQLPRLTVTRSSRRSIPESAFRSAPGNRRPMSTMATAEAVSSPTEDSAIQAMIIASESSTTEETPRPSPGPHPKKVKAKKKNGPADRALEAVLSGAAPAQDTEGQDSVNEPESTEKPEVVAQSTLRVDDITIRGASRLAVHVLTFRDHAEPENDHRTASGSASARSIQVRPLCVLSADDLARACTGSEILGRERGTTPQTWTRSLNQRSLRFTGVRSTSILRGTRRVSPDVKTERLSDQCRSLRS